MTFNTIPFNSLLEVRKLPCIAFETENMTVGRQRKTLTPLQCDIQLTAVSERVLSICLQFKNSGGTCNCCWWIYLGFKSKLQLKKPGSLRRASKKTMLADFTNSVRCTVWLFSQARIKVKDFLNSFELLAICLRVVASLCDRGTELLKGECHSTQVQLNKYSG